MAAESLLVALEITDPLGLEVVKGEIQLVAIQLLGGFLLGRLPGD